MPLPRPSIEFWVQGALSNASAEQVSPCLDERELIPPVNKRTRANQAIAHTQHIGLMLRQGQAAQVGGQLHLQQQHGAAPQVQASPAAPAAGAHAL